MPYACNSIAAASANSTSCTRCDSLCPLWRSSGNYHFVFDNSSYLSKVGTPMCYYLSVIPPNRDDVNCFYCASHCVGGIPVYLWNTKATSIMSRFNFINNTDSYGYFNLGTSAAKILRDSVILFRTTTPKIFSYTNSNFYLTIERTYLITTGTVKAETQLTTKNVWKVKSGATHQPFTEYYNLKECGPITGGFSQKYSKVPFRFFLLISQLLIAIVVTPVEGIIHWKLEDRI